METDSLAAADPVAVSWWVYCLWGMLGGLILDGMEYVRVVRASRLGRPPSRMTTWWAFAAVVAWAGIGGGLATLFGLSGQAETPLAAAVIGIAAPTILEKLSQTVVTPPVAAEQPG